MTTAAQGTHAIAVPVDPTAPLSLAPVWHETIPTVRADALAWRTRELRRPLAPGQVQRALLATYLDGADLILTTARSHLDSPALHALATAQPGLGLSGDVDLGPLPDGDIDAAVLAAVAVTLARYDGLTEVVLAVVGAALETVAFSIDDDRKVDELFARSVPDRRAAIVVQLDTGLAVGADYEPGMVTGFAVTVQVSRGPGDRLVARVRSSDAALAEMFARHLPTVFGQLRTARSVGDLQLLTAAEEAAVVELGAGRTLPSLRWATIPEAIAERTAEHPEAPAVSFESVTLSYRELDELSTRVCAGLQARGVARRARVGVCLPRSAELIAILLGILKAGAAYVPMDPDYPADRLHYTADDAELSAVVTTQSFPGHTTIHPHDLLGFTQKTPRPEFGAKADDPAYLIYTSGSTGRPKGVVVGHRSVLSLVEATRGFALGPGDTWTQFHSVAFDFSVWEIWGCLMTGGRLVVVSPLTARSPDEFFALLRNERVTVLNQTPTAFGQLAGDPGELDVRLVIFGGESLDPRLLLGWFDARPESVCRLVNMFGITETTVHVTAEELTRHSALTGSRAVGKPLPGWSVVVRDPAGRIVPIGVPGEIWVGGVGVSQGYYCRDELTAQRFVTDPTGQRYYRSGDLGRLLPDGRLEHLGRIDDQVSIRGHRVELGEISAVLLQDPQVTAAAVIVAGGRLLSFVVTSDDPLAIRRRAAGILPDYMLPATITRVDQLPLTTNGKLDVATLAALPRSAPVPVLAASDGPQQDAVQVICGVWSELLGEPVEPTDDFFELGGNSLLATKLGLALKAAGFPGLPVRELYRRPTPAGVAGYYGKGTADPC
ncbi:amino acid adenylation domain-containing protein [Kribbella antibiotica]|uniref:Amino acid adenylation domain-containing protein n=1 Tax=Kribbella antibiotica TaxID=190195 RepID=A0A4R4ZVV7_9ACTN|nr:non-ribosomal peptide synthetase [Kribbella antibiotica]TDD61282.1 amino acid adenylation domain-containing protein [Kribbella antibiotica]